MASIEREVENALLNVVSGIGGVNFFTSERGTARTLPSVTVQAQIGSEELVPFSGVFKTPASSLMWLGQTQRQEQISMPSSTTS
jgi:hypothetical protein